MKTCLNCKWLKKTGPHLGCYYQNKWKKWLNKKKAKLFAICETETFEILGEIHSFGKWERIINGSNKNVTAI